jgi:phosphatidylserine/phosphatidylglycerophosphate/cardiolipin synthase-like enzyme
MPEQLPMYPTQNQDTKPKFKRDLVYLIVIALLIALSGQFYYTYHYKPQAARDIQIYYNQDHQVNKEVTRTIQDAEKFVYFAIYTFTREDIRDALLAAKYRGLEVRGIMDKKQSLALDGQRAILNELQKAGISVVLNDHSYIMHLKTVVTDKGFVSGSYNWTASGTNLNDELIEVGTDEDIRKQYERIIIDIINRYEERAELK